MASQSAVLFSLSSLNSLFPLLHPSLPQYQFPLRPAKEEFRETLTARVKPTVPAVQLDVQLHEDAYFASARA